MLKAGEHAVVVGGTSGIGLHLSRAVSDLGCKLTITGRGAERVSKIASSLGPDVTGHHLDLEDTESIKSALSAGPAVDYLILVPVYSLATSVKHFDIAGSNRLLQIKLTGYVTAVHTILPRLKPTSSILLFGGIAKALPYPSSTMLSVANGGIVGMTRTMAVELSPIRVNSISPGLVVDSPKWASILEKGPNPVVEAWTRSTPTKRLTHVSDVIHASLFLLDNPAVNGQDLEIDGGIRLT
jgi:NAD(P)-dependent dehydrogenase (short-subunit alcohol dehydrogenase family)